MAVTGYSTASRSVVVGCCPNPQRMFAYAADGRGGGRCSFRALSHSPPPPLTPPPRVKSGSEAPSVSSTGTRGTTAIRLDGGRSPTPTGKAIHYPPGARSLATRRAAAPITWRSCRPSRAPVRAILFVPSDDSNACSFGEELSEPSDEPSIVSRTGALPRGPGGAPCVTSPPLAVTPPSAALLPLAR
jgi:hypothetical protein